MTITIETLNQRGIGKFPGLVGLVFTRFEGRELEAEFKVRPELMAPNGFLHAGSVVTLADTACGYGCFANLPPGASGFTTVELKSNHLGTAKEGTVACLAKAVHVGRSTQVWDAVLTHKESGKTIALFRCTQVILYPKPADSK
ncbi:MAG TPA: PaaI family thioesterase [Steroidobacteraceae bacterium]|nr:PaaI family thioesterase [Steroidobacteraceae bacterium]